MSSVLQQDRLPRPWEHHCITVCIPYLDTPEVLAVAVRLWKLQSEPVFFLIVDSGSKSSESETLLALLAKEPSIEVARLGILSAVEHLSDRVAIAMDYAFSRCPTEFLLATHVDVFPKHRGLVKKMHSLCSASVPVAGWEMSPRGPGPDGIISGNYSDGVPGHACSMFHMPTMDRIGAGWSMRRAHHAFQLPRTNTDIHGWPDTEFCLGKILEANGIQALFLGRETNRETQENEDWTHARSFTWESLMTGQPLERQRLALEAARARIMEWQMEHAHAALNRRKLSLSEAASPGPQHKARLENTPEPPAIAPCLARRELPDDPTVFFCAHPSVHVQNCLVTADLCAQCGYRNQPPRQGLRTFTPRPGLIRRRSPPADVSVLILFAGDDFSHLEDALASVLNQSHPAREVVVVDFTYLRETAHVLSNHSDCGVRHLVANATEPHTAIHAAVRSAVASVVCIISSHDFLSPCFLEQGLRGFADPEVAIVHPTVEPFGATDVQFADTKPPGTDLAHGTEIVPFGILVLTRIYEYLINSGRFVSRTGNIGSFDASSPTKSDLADWKSRLQLGVYHRRVGMRCLHDETLNARRILGDVEPSSRQRLPMRERERTPETVIHMPAS